MRLRRRRKTRDLELELRREAYEMVRWDELEANPAAYVERMREETFAELDDSDRAVRRATVFSRIVGVGAVVVNVPLGLWNGLPWGILNFVSAAACVVMTTFTEVRGRQANRRTTESRARIAESFDSAAETATDIEVQLARIEAELDGL